METAAVPDRIEKEVYYPYPPERVWRAITDQKELGEWFVQGDFQPEVGYEYNFANDDTRVRGTVLEVEPPGKLVYTWIKNDTEIETTVIWTLEPKNDGTVLRIEHVGISQYKYSAPELFESTHHGWEYVVQAIGAHLVKEKS